MIALTIEARQSLDGRGTLVAGMGRDRAGSAWAWTAGTDEVGPVGSVADLPPHRLLAIPAGLERAPLVDALSHWPAWQVTSLAGAEIGSRVLVWGESWLTPGVLRLLRLRGSLWRAVADCEASDAEYHVTADPRTLPAAPDAAIVLTEAAPAAAGAIAACRDRGTVVLAAGAPERLDLDLYPDVHRRALRLVAWSPVGLPVAPAWPEAARFIHRLRTAGLL